MEVTVFAQTEIYPTESEDNVKVAVSNVLDNVTVTIKTSVKGSTLITTAKGQDSLIKLRNMLHNDRIRDAARRLLFKSISGNMISFYLNKQVAFAGHVSFSEETAESPLGPIKIDIEAEHPQQLVEWLAEKTREG
jgi:uncharacterized protein